MKHYFKALSLSLIPALLLFLGKWDSLFKFVHNHNFDFTESTIVTVQLYFFILGLIISAIIVPVQLVQAKDKLVKKEDQFIDLLAYSKNVYLTIMKEAVHKKGASLNTRIFVPTNDLLSKADYLFNDRKKFAIKQVNGISDPLNINKLLFEVCPQVQGLVGKTYDLKQGIIDCDVKSTEHNLTPYQISKTENVRFCSTMPILDEESNVIAVLSIDSDETITFTDEEYGIWTQQTRYYCAFIDKHVTF